MKGKSKTQKGITLIALIITIVVLLILAAVAISSIKNDGILHYAQNAADNWNKAAQNEANMLGDYLNYLNNMGSESDSTEGEGSGSGNGDGDGTDIDVTDGTTMFAKTTNTKIEDIYGNKITIPAGFKISVENTEYTKDTINVTKGVVIEDTSGNQFVWIPCGTIYTSADKSTSETITLGRYSWNGSTGTLVQPTADNPYTSNIAIKVGSYNYTEYQSGSTTPKNAIAKNINDFYESVMGTASKEGNGGYYIGRYEAGDSSNTAIANRTGTSGKSTPGTLVCKANQVPYNWILQADALSACQNMYADGYKIDGTGTFSSDLINSYAWDTAIVFIQTFGTKSNSITYASTLGYSATYNWAPQLTGVNILRATGEVDEQLNIYDMAGNCYEWTTESPDGGSIYPYAARGSYYNVNQAGYGTSLRDVRAKNTDKGSSYADVFRPLIYVGL